MSNPGNKQIMKIKELEYFMSLVKNKNFSAVADEFHVSQPTVTMAIQRLEAKYGVKLFIRDHVHRRIIVTKAGLQFARHVQAILNELTIAQREIDNAKQQKIQFGLPAIIGNYYFPALAPKLLRAHLLELLDVTEEGSEHLLQMVLDGDLDMAFLGSDHTPHNDQLTIHEFTKFPFKLIVGDTNPLAHRHQIAFNELRGQSFIMPDTDFIHVAAFHQMARAAHIRPKVIYRTNDVHIIKQLVAENVGVSFLTSLALTPEDRLTALKFTDQQQPHFYLSLVKRGNELLTPSQQRLWEILTQKN